MDDGTYVKCAEYDDGVGGMVDAALQVEATDKDEVNVRIALSGRERDDDDDRPSIYLHPAEASALADLLVQAARDAHAMEATS